MYVFVAMKDESVKTLLDLMEEGNALYEANETVKPLHETQPTDAVRVEQHAGGAPSTSPPVEATPDGAAEHAESPVEELPAVSQRDIDRLLHSAHKTHRTAVKTLEAHQRIAVVPISSYLPGAVAGT